MKQVLAEECQQSLQLSRFLLIPLL